MSYKYLSIFTLAAAIFSTASCGFDEEPLASSVSCGDVTITACFEQPQDDTRTTLENGGSVIWSVGDAFALLTDKTKDRFEIASGAGTATASFSGSVSGFAPFYAFYPYSENCSISNGSVMFSLPQTQSYVNNTFASGVSPAIANLSSATSAANFKNLCGILQLNLCGTGSPVIKGLEIINLDGKPLWGDCSVALDGKQGTDDQTMTVTGGSNVIKVSFQNAVKLMASTPRIVDVVVPQNSFAKGFSVRVIDTAGAVMSFLTTQSEQVVIARSGITAMTNIKIPTNGEFLDVSRRGYYKDVFMDGGCNLSSRTTLPACPYLGWSLDYLATSDSLFQQQVIVSSSNDANGALLYPDGEPRYRMMYVNGGKASSHAKSLNATGRSRIISFVEAGGAYVGTCAGAFLVHNDTGSPYYQLNLIPAYMYSSGLSESSTGLKIPEGSPLLKYYDYGGDHYISNLYHNGGGYVKEAYIPSKAAILATYDKPGWKMDDNGCIWAYKANDEQGRLVACGSHPEDETSGEQRDLMAAMMRYATEGAGTVEAKAQMKKGVTLKYSATTGANAGIGDKQYHHFIVTIPTGARNITFTLDSDGKFDLHLALRKGALAWRTDADFVLAQTGNKKTLKLDTLAAGIWYVSVYCPATITTSCSSNNFQQSGDTGALNGVPYSITVNWN